MCVWGGGGGGVIFITKNLYSHETRKYSAKISVTVCHAKNANCLLYISDPQKY